jgi:hypothetical protein
MLKVMVWHVVRTDPHKVMTALIVMLRSNCCSGYHFFCNFVDYAISVDLLGKLHQDLHQVAWYVFLFQYSI